MITVRFVDVGEGTDEKITFDAELRFFDGQEIIRALKRNRALRSEPDVWYKDNKGIVYIGGYRPVGTFYVLQGNHQATAQQQY